MGEHVDDMVETRNKNLMMRLCQVGYLEDDSMIHRYHDGVV